MFRRLEFPCAPLLPAPPLRCLADDGDAEDGSELVLVWRDEFDYEGPPDPHKWEAQTDCNNWIHDRGHNEVRVLLLWRAMHVSARTGPFGAMKLTPPFSHLPLPPSRPQVQWYSDSPSNSWVSGGLLRITAERHEGGGVPFTSARIRTKGKGDWVYGRFEVCAKVPPFRRGVWPAIWMMPTDSKYGRWPASGEIDILECVGHKRATMHASVHTTAANHRAGKLTSGHWQCDDADGEFHVYAPSGARLPTPSGRRARVHVREPRSKPPRARGEAAARAEGEGEGEAAARDGGGGSRGR